MLDPAEVDQRLFFHRFSADQTPLYRYTITGISYFDPQSWQLPGWNFYYYDTGNVVMVDLEASRTGPPYRFVVTKDPQLVAAMAAAAPHVWYKRHAILGGPPAVYDAASALLGYGPSGDVEAPHGIVEEGGWPSYSPPDLSKILPPVPTPAPLPSVAPSVAPSPEVPQGVTPPSTKTTGPAAPGWLVPVVTGVGLLTVGALVYVVRR